MESIHLLPSLSRLPRLALSLIKSESITNSRKEMCEKLAMADFDVDAKTGFVPRKPLPHLQHPFNIWEDALADAPEILSLGEDDSDMAVERRDGGEAWRQSVKSWPTLNVGLLQDDRPRLQRAHMVLAWLVNFYVHSTPSSDGPTHVPRQLAVPLVQVSRILGMAPVLTFADTVLWNWELIDPKQPTKYENVRITNNFSGNDDERNFYAVSLRAELEGAEILHILENYHNLRHVLDTTSISKISGDLIKLVGLIDYLNEIIQSVRNCCDPRVFYRDIRPWLEGSNMKGPICRNWVYEGVEDSATLDLSGPSGGQSSVMHALDVFLGVDHKNQDGCPLALDKAVTGFMARMMRYMPGQHRDYLCRLAATPRPIRELALRTPTLREPYDLAVRALKNLREKHMRIAFLYIVTMSKSFPAKPSCPEGLKVGGVKGPANKVVRGTGGNDVAVLLKACRDATRRTLVGGY